MSVHTGTHKSHDGLCEEPVSWEINFTTSNMQIIFTLHNQIKHSQAVGKLYTKAVLKWKDDFGEKWC